MPRSIVVAIVCLSLLGIVGLGACAVAVADVAVNGIWSDHGLFAQLRLPGRALSVLVKGMFPLLVVHALKGIARRDGRIRSGIVLSAFLMLIPLAIVLGAFLFMSVLQRNLVQAAVVATVLAPFVALFATASYALSRPSAKAWFASSAAVTRRTSAP